MAFTNYCKSVQPETSEDVQRFFEGVICFPYDNELLLQAYLFLNIDHIFPYCQELLLFEKPPYGGYTNKGKCDFVYLADDHQLCLIETKYIDLDAHGGTKRKRRNKHRNKVFEQVLGLKKTFCEYWQLADDHIQCAVFTTDPQLFLRGEELRVKAQYVSIADLNQWQKQLKGDLRNAIDR
ncbi:MAG: hypothetical protein F6K30_02560 [Cyanothece sp. SIO2G6]|nr:hypothetical protein [Cyanothece sp. SIO2G6]